MFKLFSTVHQGLAGVNRCDNIVVIDRVSEPGRRKDALHFRCCAAYRYLQTHGLLADCFYTMLSGYIEINNFSVFCEKQGKTTCTSKICCLDIYRKENVIR